MLIKNKEDLKKTVELKLIVATNTEDCGFVMISPDVQFDAEFFNEPIKQA